MDSSKVDSSVLKVYTRNQSPTTIVKSPVKKKRTEQTKLELSFSLKGFRYRKELEDQNSLRNSRSEGIEVSRSQKINFLFLTIKIVQQNF